MRPCSETAHSPRSRRPPPSIVRCASRTRLTRIADHHASPTPIAPTATPAIATISACVAVACTAATLAEREDDRVAGLVVVGLDLARHRRHVDVHLLLLS